MPMRTRGAFIITAAIIGVLGLALGTLVVAPNTVCRLWALALGDEGQGECLGMAARMSGFGRCKAVAALLGEIETTNNDVVISLGLKGLVRKLACDDLAFLWTSLPRDCPSHARQLVAAAAVACKERRPYSLGVARSFDEPVMSPGVFVESARRSRCAARAFVVPR